MAQGTAGLLTRKGALLNKLTAAKDDLARIERDVVGSASHLRHLEATLTIHGGRFVRDESGPIISSGRGAYSRAIEELDRLERIFPPMADRFGFRQELGQADGTSGVLIDAAIESLRRSWPGYISTSVCDIVESAAETVPDITLRPEMLLNASCFLLLGRPMVIEAVSVDRGITRETVRAVSWYSYGPGDGITNHQEAGVFLMFWIDLKSQEPALQALRVFPMNVASWIFGETRTQSLRIAKAPEDHWVLNLGSRWLAAFTAFCEQRLLQAEPLAPERATRKRLEREGRPLRDVLVIELRRPHHQAADSSGKREWSCSWVVRGHWRQQACGPGWKDRRAVWIDPYPKGPDDKEFRVNPQRVFNIVH